MSIKVTSFIIGGAPLEGENPLPHFRAREHNTYPEAIEPFPDNKKELMGYETAFRVLPYRMQDRYSRSRRPMYVKAIILENELVEAVFLPEYGGRLYSLYDKRTGKDMLYKNPVFQPANLAIRNAWFSGGIEWNIGQLGHTFSTCSPVFAAKVKEDSGEEFLRIYEFERCKGLFWQIDFHLPEGSDILYAHTRIINPSETNVPMYWWTNIAVKETEGLRIFAPADDVIYINPSIGKSGRWGYGLSRMPVIPSLPDKDFSYPWSSNFANEYFFQVHDEERGPWEAAIYEDGSMFFEVSTCNLRYRKMFCWGNHAGGRRWQEYLSKPGEGYVEIQGGLTPTQLHGIDMPGGAAWEWTQAFSTSKVDGGSAHKKDWFAARSTVEEEVRRKLSFDKLYETDSFCQRCAPKQPSEILHNGTGWGSLELMRMKDKGIAEKFEGLLFPLSCIGPEQYPWLHLLNTGVLPEHDIHEVPISWMVQREWEEMLKRSIESPENRNWNALLHYGVIMYEKGCEEEAMEVWKESLEKTPSVWVYRNMASVEKMRGSLDTALSYMEKALEIEGGFCDQALAEEYMTLLSDKGKYERVWEYYTVLPQKYASADRIKILAGAAALEIGNLDFASGIFEHEYAVIREGEVLLTELWFKYHAKMLAKEKGMEYNPELVEECRKLYPPPKHIDYRLKIE